jgi:predicted ATPase with chaperone activity
VNLARERTVGVRIWGAINDRLIEVLTETSNDGGGLRLEGLPPTHRRTAGDRVRSALINSGLLPEMPPLIARLEPDVRSEWTCGLDLPIALAVLTRTGAIADVPWIFAGGRLGLDGRIYAVDLDETLSIVTVVDELVRPLR